MSGHRSSPENEGRRVGIGITSRLLVQPTTWQPRGPPMSLPGPGAHFVPALCQALCHRMKCVLESLRWFVWVSPQSTVKGQVPRVSPLGNMWTSRKGASWEVLGSLGIALKGTKGPCSFSSSSACIWIALPCTPALVCCHL